MKYLLEKDKYRYKANLGCYSTVSFGHLSPEEIKKEYINKGYSIVAYSEENILSSQSKLSDSEFLALLSYKTSIENYHFTLYSKTQGSTDMADKPYGANIKERVNEFILNAKNMGFLVCIDHPAKSMQTYHDYDGVSGYFALEIADYSSLVEGHIEDNNHIYDRILRNSTLPVFPLAYDSNRNIYPLDSVRKDSFGAFTMIASEDLSYCSVIDALENGKFYSSTGPTFEEIWLDGNTIHIECSPVRSIRLLNEGRDAPIAIAPEGELITEAEFEIDKDAFGKLIRVDIRDKNGNFANTVPYYFEDILGEQE